LYRKHQEESGKVEALPRKDSRSPSVPKVSKAWWAKRNRASVGSVDKKDTQKGIVQTDDKMHRSFWQLVVLFYVVISNAISHHFSSDMSLNFWKRMVKGRST
jgi:hypothetical protein